jgi:hypothetical protein
VKWICSAQPSSATKACRVPWFRLNTDQNFPYLYLRLIFISLLFIPSSIADISFVVTRCLFRSSRIALVVVHLRLPASRNWTRLSSHLAIRPPQRRTPTPLSHSHCRARYVQYDSPQSSRPAPVPNTPIAFQRSPPTRFIRCLETTELKARTLSMVAIK